MTGAKRVPRRKEPYGQAGAYHKLAQFKIVVSPSARAIIGDAASIRPKLKAALAPNEAQLPQEIVLWRGNEPERVAALVNAYVKTIYVEHFGAPNGDLRRDDAIKTVALGIGARPDLPSGTEYVRRVRGIWRGLLPLERS